MNHHIRNDEALESRLKRALYGSHKEIPEIVGFDN